MKRRLILPILFCLCIFLSSSAGAVSYPDVPSDTWYTAAVEDMTARGLLSGCDDGTFQPMREITCAEFVSITARCAGLAPVAGQVSHWAAGTMEAALQAHWYDWDEIPPDPARFDTPIPRQLAVKVLMEALFPEERGDYTTESIKMKDFSTLSGRYYQPVLAAYGAGIVSGDDQGNFSPLRNLSRAEACVLFHRALEALSGILPQPTASAAPAPTPAVARAGGVSENGWLKAVGTQLCNESGEPVVLHGMSSHGLQWYPNFTCTQSIQNTAAHGANVFRLAMYTAEDGYLSHPETMKERLIAAADAAIAQDMYVILDWHILADGSPSAHIDEAVAFFTEMAQRYKDCPAVLYEICNEPNGPVTWEGDVKPYAEKLVSTIRAYAKNSVILIGSPTWSQDIHLAAQSPVAGDNLMYTLHFYAGTHGKELRDRIDSVLKQGLPVFVSEWGTSRADGSGGVFLAESDVWLDFLAQRSISWCNWSLADRDETSAALRPGTPAARPWTQDDLSQSGAYVFSKF